MSDPVTNVEIEDVLSSIRKLVSADDRPVNKVVDALEGQVDKLVLTPALRVDDEATDAAETPAAQNQGADPASEAEPDTRAASITVDAVYTDQSHIDDVADDRDVFDEAGGDDGIEDAEIIEDDGGDEAAPDTAWTDFDDDAPDSLTARVAELEKAVAARDDGWEPDGSTPDENAAEPTAALHWQDHVPDASDAAVAFHDTDEPEDVEPPITDDPAHDPFMEMAGEFDETGYEEDDASSDARLTGAATAGPTNAFLADEDLLDDGSEAILDEETLRDLVAEIVRQELQGSLGERITRNVRKLVRREIQRALATQDLE